MKIRTQKNIVVILMLSFALLNTSCLQGQEALTDSGVSEKGRKCNKNCESTPEPTPEPIPDPIPAPEPTPTFSWIMGFDGRAIPAMSTPAVNVPFTEAAYKTKVTRVTTASQVTDATVNWVRHEYAKRPVFNSDGTKALMFSGNYKIYNVDKVGNKMTFVRTAKDINGSVINDKKEANWHPTDPNIFYYFLGRKIVAYNVSTSLSTVVSDLSSALSAAGLGTVEEISTLGEGKPSADGNIWCLTVGRGTTSSPFKGMLSYNLSTKTIIGKLVTTSTPNHIMTSPKGNYCIVAGGAGGTRSFGLDFTNPRTLYSTSVHSDIGITAAGAEVFVFADFAGNGYLAMIDLATGARTNLYSLYSNGHMASLHISAANVSKPGYVVISTYYCRSLSDATIKCPEDNWLKEKLAIVELHAYPNIYNVAQIRNDYAEVRTSTNGYWFQAHAVPSKDLSKIVYQSSWGGTTDSSISSYMVDIPAGSLP